MQWPEYLEWVRRQPCLVLGCKTDTVDAHHIVSMGWRKAKRDDTAAIPLCRAHHTELHAEGIARFEERHLSEETEIYKDAWWCLREFIKEERKHDDGL